MNLKLGYILMLIFNVNILQATSVQLDSIKTYLVNPSTKVKGSIHRINKFPSKFVTPRNIDIWIPEEFDKSKT